MGRFFFSSSVNKIGDIIIDTFLDSSLWPVVGSSSYTFANKLTLSSTDDGTYNNYIYRTGTVSNFRTQAIRCYFKVKDIVGSGRGFGFGFKSVNNTAELSNLIEINTNGGSVNVFLKLLGNVVYKSAWSGSNVSCSVNDKIIITVIQLDGIQYLTVINSSTGQKSIYDVFDYPTIYPVNSEGYLVSNTGQLAIWTLGGNYELTSITLSSDYNKNSSIAFIGDSITHGTLTARENLYTHIAGGKNDFIVYAGSGDKSRETLLAAPLLVAQRPKKVFIMIGVNDGGNGVSMSTWLSNVLAIKTMFEQRGTIVLFGAILPNASFDPTSWNNALITAVGSDKVMMTAYNSLLGSGYNMNSSYTNDGVHPNIAGSLILGNCVKAFISI